MSRPTAFIGSSAEGLTIAKAVQTNLEHVAECQIWSQGVFGLTEGTLETLVNKLDDYDFAVFVLTPDDVEISREESRVTPRDNVLFELGLFMGRIGRKRTFMVLDREADTKLPSDLAGVTPSLYSKPTKTNWEAALGTACSAIEKAIKAEGERQPDAKRAIPENSKGLRRLRLRLQDCDWSENQKQYVIELFETMEEGAFSAEFDVDGASMSVFSNGDLQFRGFHEY